MYIYIYIYIYMCICIYIYTHIYIYIYISILVCTKYIIYTVVLCNGNWIFSKRSTYTIKFYVRLLRKVTCNNVDYKIGMPGNGISNSYRPGTPLYLLINHKTSTFTRFYENFYRAITSFAPALCNIYASRPNLRSFPKNGLHLQVQKVYGSTNHI